MQIVAGGDARKHLGGLAADDDGRGDLALLDRGERIRLAHVDLLDGDGQQSEHVACRDLRARAGIGEVHLLAVEILQRLDIAARHHVHFLRVEAGDVVQPLVGRAAELAGGCEIAQHVR